VPDTVGVLYDRNLRQQWEQRATDLRRFAETVLVPSIKDGILKAAAHYERMARGLSPEVRVELADDSWFGGAR